MQSKPVLSSSHCHSCSNLHLFTSHSTPPLCAGKLSIVRATNAPSASWGVGSWCLGIPALLLTQTKRTWVVAVVSSKVVAEQIPGLTAEILVLFFRALLLLSHTVWKTRGLCRGQPRSVKEDLCAMLSATWLLQGSSALQVSPWVSLAACEFLSLPASGNLVDIEQMYRKGKRMQGRQRVFLMLLFMACLFLLPLLLLHLSNTSFGACGF